MKIKDIALSAAYVGQRVVKAICVGAQEVWSAVKYIIFKDPVVGQICVANFSSDGVGVTEEDAAKVTSIDTIFRENTEIVSFDELQYFTDVKILHTEAFKGCTNLKSISLKNVEIVDAYAFAKCGSLEYAVDAPNLKEIHSLIGNVWIKNLQNVEVLGTAVFANNTHIKSVNFPKLKRIESYGNFTNSVIESIDNLGTIDKIPDGGDFGFAITTTLRSVNLPSTLTYVGSGAFKNCRNLENITWYPENFTYIGNQAFQSCKFSIEILTLPVLTELGGAAFSGVDIKRIDNLGRITALKEYYGGAFRNCKALEYANIPSTVTSIQSGVFSGCSNLVKVILNPPTPPTLVADAFSGTHSTMTIYVPDQSVTAYREASGWLSYADRIKPLSQYVES